MWFVLPLSPLGKKRGVLFCFGVSFSHIHHHVILLLLLANAAAFVLGETRLPMKLVQLLKGSCKTEHLHYPSLSSPACLSSTPLSAGSNTEAMPEIGTFKQLGCAVLKATRLPKFAYKSSTWKWPCKVFTCCSVPWWLMNCLNNEKSRPFTPHSCSNGISIMASASCQTLQWCISFGVKALPPLLIQVTATHTFFSTNRRWNGLWGNHWPLREKRE